MARRCELTGVGVLTGNNVSHANNRSRRRFLPNIQRVSLQSNALGSTVHLRVTAATLRTVEHNGGLDSFLVSFSDSKLTATGIRLKRQVKKALAAKQAVVAA